MKKVNGLIFALILAVGALSGCAGNSGNSSSSASDSVRGKSGVQVYGTMDTGIGYQSRTISRD